jgi:hypothetical protein
MPGRGGIARCPAGIGRRFGARPPIIERPTGARGVESSARTHERFLMFRVTPRTASGATAILTLSNRRHDQIADCASVP